MISSEAAAGHFSAGVEKLDNGDPLGAEACLRRALELQPDYTEAHYKLANALRDQDRPADAEQHYSEVLRLDPRHAEAHNNLGALLQSMGRIEEAVASYRRAMQAKPALPQPYMNLGRLLLELGRPEEAQSCYRNALDQGLDDDVFRHLFVAAQGGNSSQSQSAAAKAPESYVRETFDNFAARFDRHLIGTLDYHIPDMISAAVRELAPQRKLDILDLGCGTGLCGQHLKDLARTLAGVDLSPKMLEQGRLRGCYDELIEAEIGAYLRAHAPDRIDLVVAADALIYIGDLAPVMVETARVLRPDGLFALSIEQPSIPCASFHLELSGRYAHALDYVRGLAADAGIVERMCQDVVVRKHGPREVTGHLLLLQKPLPAHGR